MWRALVPGKTTNPPPMCSKCSGQLSEMGPRLLYSTIQARLAPVRTTQGPAGPNPRVPAPAGRQLSSRPQSGSEQWQEETASTGTAASGRGA